MEHDVAASPSAWGWAVRLASLAAVVAHAAVGVGIIVWAIGRVEQGSSQPGDLAPIGGLFAFIGGVAVLGAGLPCAFLIVMVWRSRRWALLALTTLALLQGVLQV